MLSPAERDLAVRDAALPGLAPLLDGGRLGALLGQPVEAPYLRYKPGTKCVLAFRAGGEALMAIANPPHRHAVLRGRRAMREAGDAVRFFDDLSLAVMPARLDRDLRALAKLADPVQAARLLRGLSPVAEGARLRLLRHNPNRRAVLRLDGPEGPRALLKVHAPGEWPRAIANARLAEARGGARILGADEDRRLVLCDWVAGRPLWSDGQGLGATEAVAATGAALARLHRADAGLPLTPGDERRDLGAAAQALAGLLPALAERAGAVAATVAAALGAPPRAGALLHGDFSADQVILGPSGPVFIDWDRAACGDPARDIGSFLARLDAQAIDGALSRGEADRAGEALLAGYADEASLPPGIAAQNARALLALLPEGFRLRRPDWPERAAAILDRAEALLPGGGRPADALDRLVAEARAAGPRVAAVAALPQGAVTGATLLRRKPGRRALLRYPLADGGALLGKLRAKGPDLRTPRLHAALRDAGLDGRAPHRIGVPRPRGALDALHLWLQDEVPGRRLTDLLRPGAPTDAAARAGAALARLHAAAVPTDRRWTLADELAVLEAAFAQAPLPDPARADALLRRCRRLAAALPPGRESTLHRDWYPDQVIVDGDAVWLLDLDLCARGDPAVDLGNFLAHVAELSIRRHGSADALGLHEAAFLAGYAAEAGAPDATAVATLKAMSLARLVPVSRRITDRRVATGDILAAAEQAVGAVEVPYCSV